MQSGYLEIRTQQQINTCYRKQGTRSFVHRKKGNTIITRLEIAECNKNNVYIYVKFYRF